MADTVKNESIRVEMSEAHGNQVYPCQEGEESTGWNVNVEVHRNEGQEVINVSIVGSALTASPRLASDEVGEGVSALERILKDFYGRFPISKGER